MDTTRPPSSPSLRPARFRASQLVRLASVIGLAAIINAGAVDARMPRGGPQARPLPTPSATERTFPIPMSIVQQHAMITTELTAAANLPGETGVTARRVLALVTPHFRDEQRRVDPLLQLLPLLAAHQTESWMAELVPLADRLPRDLDELLHAQVAIDAGLDELYAAAWRENHPQYAFLAMRIRHHEQLEREITYPAALVVGDELQIHFPTATARRES
jgi:hypothetical protein